MNSYLFIIYVKADVLLIQTIQSFKFLFLQILDHSSQGHGLFCFDDPESAFAEAGLEIFAWAHVGAFASERDL